MHRAANARRRQNLTNSKTDIEDKSYRSEYFVISDLQSTFTAGKNHFTINGSQLLKNNTGILLEILDSSGTPLYYETGKSGYESYVETTDLVVSAHVFDTTSAGFGTITLIGTTIEGKSVKWSSTIKIDPTIDNSSRVIFLERPTMEATPFLSYVLNEGWTTTAQESILVSGSIKCHAAFPSVFTDVSTINVRKSDIDYRLSFANPEDPTLTSFSRENAQSELTLYISEISVLDNGSPKNISVDITQSARIKSVLNSSTVNLESPITYVTNNVRQIVPVISGSFSQRFFATSYITSSGLVPDGNPDGVPDPNVFLQKPVGSTYAFLKEPFLDITYRNLKTLTGKLHRHKIYRRSLNKASEFECVADEPLLETETLFDSSTANRAFARIGEFYNLDHIHRYYYTSSVNLSIQQSSEEVLNSMILSLTVENLNGTEYVIVKNDTSLLTVSSSREKYVNYDYNQSLIKSGSSYDSNFITLYKGSDYLISADVDITKLDSAKESSLMFFFTGSYNTASAQSEPSFFENRGIKLHEYVLPLGKDRATFSGKHFGKIISFTNDCIGTFVIVPVNIRSARISNLSLKTFAEFGFSPDVFSTRIFFPVTIKNEQFEIRSEFFDINSKSIFSGINSIVNVDREGETLFKNITNYLITDSDTIRSVISSGSLTISSSRVVGGTGYDSAGNRAALSVVESFVVQSGSGNDRNPFFIAEFGPGNTGPSVRVSGSLKLTGSMYVMGVDERLYATSSWAISSSYAYKASSSLSSSGAESSLSSSWAISSSFAYRSNNSDSSSHLVYTEDVAPVGSPTVAGYLTATLNGTRIYIPYFTSV